MSRNLDAATQSQLDSTFFRCALFLQITFRSETSYVSTLPCDFTWGGQTWTGAGAMGKVGVIEEGIDVEARGITVSLSGIDPVLLPESLSDIKLGASAKLYMGFFGPDTQALTLVSTPVCLFAGIVDQPSVNMDPKGGAVTISLNIESSLLRLQRACNLMLTPADQKISHPDDTGLDQVNLLAWQALKWGA